jgi:hypothetical protein
VTAAAHNYDNYQELHRLLDELSPAEAEAVRTLVLVFRTSQVPSPDRDATTDEWPPPWFGSVTAGEPDAAERAREILRAEYGRS